MNKEQIKILIQIIELIVDRQEKIKSNIKNLQNEILLLNIQIDILKNKELMRCSKGCSKGCCKCSK